VFARIIQYFRRRAAEKKLHAARREVTWHVDSEDRYGWDDFEGYMQLTKKVEIAEGEVIALGGRI
jgi:hypothetical protein